MSTKEGMLFRGLCALGALGGYPLFTFSCCQKIQRAQNGCIKIVIRGLACWTEPIAA